MKRFQFSLETVLDYKAQILENLKTEQAVIGRAVLSQQEQVERVGEALNGYESEFNRTKSLGASIENFRLMDMCIVRQKEILDAEAGRLADLKEQEERKKQEVVQAKVDTSRYEKLKDRRFQAYNKTAAKAEEQFAEEFVVRGYVQRRRQNRG